MKSVTFKYKRIISKFLIKIFLSCFHRTVGIYTPSKLKKIGGFFLEKFAFNMYSNSSVKTT